MAIFRQLSLVFQLVVALYFGHVLPSSMYAALTTLPYDLEPFDVFIVDQLSVCVPLLRLLLKTRVVFYCHFPDKDVGESLALQRAQQRGRSRPSLLRAVYRLPLDMLEEGTIGAADKVLVNSQFTSDQFVRSFFRLNRIPRIVYPGIDLAQSSAEEVARANAHLEREERDAEDDGDHGVKEAIRALVDDADRPTLLSINRFEAKKNIALALDAFALVRRERAASSSSSSKAPLRLVVAGGYDRRVGDNVATLAALEKQCADAGLSSQTLFYKRPTFEPPRSGPNAEEMRRATVIFLPSLPGPLLSRLLRNPATLVLLYTPTNEHFGIVPLEAMAVGKAVVAVDAGGPLETVVDLGLRRSAQAAVVEVDHPDEGTGLLRRADARVWAGATLSLLELLEDKPGFREQLARTARKRVTDVFSVEAMSRKFDDVVADVVAMGPVRPEEGALQFGIAFGSEFVPCCTVQDEQLRRSISCGNSVHPHDDGLYRRHDLRRPQGGKRSRRGAAHHCLAPVPAPGRAPSLIVICVLSHYNFFNSQIQL